VIEGWLRAAGFFQDGDRLYVSGEQRAGKGSGALFERASAELGVPLSEWAHTGDHPWSDQWKPRALGLAVRPARHAALRPRERAVAAAGDAPARSMLAGAMRCARLADAAPDPDGLSDVAAGVAGPLFLGFVRWCLQEAAARGVRRLYFLARGGQIFWRIAQELGPQGFPPIECRYLYASRLAFVGAAAADRPQDWRALAAPPLRRAKHHSVHQAVAALGLDPTEAAGLVPAGLGPDWDRNLDETERAILADALLDLGQAPRLRAALADRAAAARAYLAAEGVDPREPIALVDTGWMGSTQRALEHLLGGPMTGFYLGLVEPRSDAAGGEQLGYTNRFARLPLRRQTSHLVLLELLAQADHGPLLGFRRDGSGAAMPLLGPVGPVDPPAIRRLQHGILKFARTYLATAAGREEPDAAWARTVIRNYRNFHDHPSRVEAEAFGRMPHSDQMCEGAFDQLAPPLGLAGATAAVLTPRRRPPCWWIEGQAALGSAGLLRSYAAAKRAKWFLQTRLTGLRD